MNERIDELKERLERHLSVSTTSESTGYPKNIRTAYFPEDWDDIQDLMKGNEDLLSCEVFMKHRGWDLFYRTGKWADAPFKITADLLGGIKEYHNSNEVFTECMENVKGRDWSCVEEVYNYVEKMRDMADYAENLGDDEVMIEFEGFFGIFYKEDVSYSEDEKDYKIGLIFK